MFKTRGLRHLALRVKDVERSGRFYAQLFEMKEVWRPDPDNLYLSSGCDNLALHRATGEEEASTSSTNDLTQRLDHLGFIVPSVSDLENGYEMALREGLDIVHPLRHHRDGSASFYIRDPDGNVIQLLFEPGISPLEFKPTK